MSKYRASIQAAVVLWRKHGAQASVWTVTGGEVGNTVVSFMFPDFKAYGECMDRLTADPGFQAWRADNVTSGLSSWVRSNIAQELPVD
ncbi:MAG: hypothetical protein KGL68_09360 [Burkholderiales bacterium]|nr:hypothetical protein [Burkholderiales bacterium]